MANLKAWRSYWNDGLKEARRSGSYHYVYVAAHFVCLAGILAEGRGFMDYATGALTVCYLFNSLSEEV